MYCNSLASHVFAPFSAIAIYTVQHQNQWSRICVKNNKPLNVIAIKNQRKHRCLNISHTLPISVFVVVSYFTIVKSCFDFFSLALALLLLLPLFSSPVCWTKLKRRSWSECYVSVRAWSSWSLFAVKLVCNAVWLCDKQFYSYGFIVLTIYLCDRKSWFWLNRLLLSQCVRFSSALCSVPSHKNHSGFVRSWFIASQLRLNRQNVFPYVNTTRQRNCV